MTFLLIPPYLIFALFVIRNVLKKQHTRKRKWQMGLLTAFLLYLPFGWDVILGRAVFYGLCETQGGVHVYKTVELGAEYFDKDGVPLFYDRREFFKNMTLAKYYIGVDINDSPKSSLFDIGKSNYKIKDIRNSKVLGEYIGYANFGGWFVNHTGFVMKGDACLPLII